MKKCPFCGADLADEAQFCLYCMTPLKEKEQILPAKRRPKGWLFVLGGVLLLTVVLLLLWPRTGDASNEPVMQVTTMPTTATTLPTTGTTVPSTAPSTSSSTTVSTTTKPTTAPTTAKPTTTPTTLPTATNEVQYLYRAAKAGDMYHSYQLSDNQIVITGIENPVDDGVYHIPGTIDGQTVVGIVSNAFANSSAEQVYIPASVVCIRDYAFMGCPLTDVYFIGDRIFCFENAFPSGVTIHSTPDCIDLYYSNHFVAYAYRYGGTWRAWYDIPGITGADVSGTTYYYRLSEPRDNAADSSYQNPGNHITIIGVQANKAGGVFRVPETISGMTVAFIGPFALNGVNLKHLYLPESVIALSYNALWYTALTNFYFTHDLYIPTSNHPPITTVFHCPEDARCGPGGVLYSEKSTNWSGAKWEDWGGVFPPEVVYSYRLAQSGDDFSASYQNPGNHIVITGVEFPSPDGIYDIPATIDGKTVVAIMSNAFYSSGATKIFIPDSVQTIHDHAFNGCALTDVYFRGDAIYCYPNAFPKNFTLHCSAECHDRNLRYYKSSAVNYSATWEEWNGDA